MARIRRRILVSGRVQGVCFRAFTQDEADRLGLVGWVRNIPTGDVEIEVEGEEDAVEALQGRLHQGPPASRVERITSEDLGVLEREDRFQVRF